jgi:hypothetical protein
MNPDTYRKLEEIFSKFNESIIEMYTGLMELYPERKRGDLLEALRLTLQNSGEVYRYVSQKLFEANK